MSSRAREEETHPSNCSIVSNLSFRSRSDLITTVGIFTHTNKKLNKRIFIQARIFTVVQNEIRFPEEITGNVNEFNVAKVLGWPCQAGIVPFLKTECLSFIEKQLNIIFTDVKDVDMRLHDLILLVLKRKHRSATTKLRHLQHQRSGWVSGQVSSWQDRSCSSLDERICCISTSRLDTSVAYVRFVLRERERCEGHEYSCHTDTWLTDHCREDEEIDCPRLHHASSMRSIRNVWCWAARAVPLTNKWSLLPLFPRSPAYLHILEPMRTLLISVFVSSLTQQSKYDECHSFWQAKHSIRSAFHLSHMKTKQDCYERVEITNERLYVNASLPCWIKKEVSTAVAAVKGERGIRTASLIAWLVVFAFEIELDVCSLPSFIRRTKFGIHWHIEEIRSLFVGNCFIFLAFDSVVRWVVLEDLFDLSPCWSYSLPCSSARFLRSTHWAVKKI